MSIVRRDNHRNDGRKNIHIPRSMDPPVASKVAVKYFGCDAVLAGEMRTTVRNYVRT